MIQNTTKKVLIAFTFFTSVTKIVNILNFHNNGQVASNFVISFFFNYDFIFLKQYQCYTTNDIGGIVSITK